MTESSKTSTFAIISNFSFSRKELKKMNKKIKDII